MKKVLLSCATIGFLTLMSVSCSKKSETAHPEKKVDLQRIDNDLKAINTKYAVHTAHAKTTASKGSGRAWVTAGADVMGGLAAGASAGYFLGAGPIGAFFTGFAMGVGACVASAATYNSWNNLVVDGGSGGTGGSGGKTQSQIQSAIANFSGSYAVPNPYLNPFEGVGARHNQLLTEWCKKAVQPIFTNSTFIFDTTDLDSNELASIAATAPNTEISSMYNCLTQAQVSFVDNNGVYTAMPFFSYVSPAIQDTVITNIFSVFFSGLSQFDDNDQTDEMAFINSYENYFMNTNANSLTTMETQIVLSNLAVAKHSLTLWNNALYN